MDGNIRPARPRSGRTLLVAVIAIVAVLVVAAVAAFMLGLFDAPGGNGDTNGGDNNGGLGGDDQLPYDISDGDFIEFSISHSEGVIEGTMRMTFLNVTDDSYDVRMEQTINGMTFNFTWTADANDTVGSISDDDEPEDFGELIGEEVIETEFGPRNVLHYRATEDGAVIDYYIGEESPIMYRMVTTDDEGVLTYELVDTNIEDIRNANA
ncbi:hypothetical protein AOA80_01520 [Methanomassiliicoccales archaeon RumEn M1]|jgi:hypothetical protein|nr:hypothetical protein AOA80_01520 [Methanomassiliicoccales archaeon RumEn M1]